MIGIERKKNRVAFYTMTFLFGAMAGAAAALLFAPMPGRKLQRQLKEVIDDSVENVQTAYRKLAHA